MNRPLDLTTAIQVDTQLFQHLGCKADGLKGSKVKHITSFSLSILLIGLAYATGMAVKHHVAKQQINHWWFIIHMYIQDLSDSGYTGLDFGNVGTLRSGGFGQDGSYSLRFHNAQHSHRSH